MLQKHYITVLTKSEDSTEFRKKSSFSGKLKITKLEQRLFYQKLFLIPNFDYLRKNGKKDWISNVLSSETHFLSIGQGFTYGKLSGVPLDILSNVYYVPLNVLNCGCRYTCIHITRVSARHLIFTLTKLTRFVSSLFYIVYLSFVQCDQRQ